MDWTARARAAFEPGTCPDDGILEELGQHAADVCQAALAGGRAPADAEREAVALLAAFARHPAPLRRPVGPPRAVEPPPGAASFCTGCGQDFRYAWRRLRAGRGHSLVVVLTVALGIAATSVLFSVVYAVLLHPLPWPDADRLVRLYETRQGSTRPARLFTNATYLAWSQRPTTIEGIAAYMAESMTVTGQGGPESVSVASATPSLFPVLRAQPALGRLFSAAPDDDNRPADTRELILGYGLWQRHFGGRRDVIGRVLTLDGNAYRVVGVMPAGFAFPDRDTSAWIPFSVPALDEGGVVPRLKILDAIARLKPGFTAEQAAAEGAARGRSAPERRLATRALFGSNGAVQVRAVPLIEALTGDVRQALVVLLAAVGLLLVAATANVANLQLARATGRRREMAIRSALGAGSGRLSRQLLIENGLLGLAGGGAGLAVAGAVLRVLPSLLPADFPRAADIAFDWRVAVFALGLALVTGIAFGLVPALAARRVNLVGSLAEDGLAPAGWGARTHTVRARLVIMAAQVAVACVLLLGAALLARSFAALVAADRGYDPANVLTSLLPLPDAAFTPQRRAEVLESTVARVKAIPGVIDAGYTTRLPLTPGETLAAFPVPDRRGTGMITARALMRSVSPGYLRAIGLRLVEGRGFAATDLPDAPRVVVVNREFARQFLDARAVGARLPTTGNRYMQVVGIVDDVTYGDPGERTQPELYDCICQAGVGSYDRYAVAVRTRHDVSRLAPAVRAIVKEQAPAAVLESVATMEDRISTSVAKPRLYALLLAGFALFAIAVAGVGLFGVLSYSVLQRSREIGVRASLGARPRHIVGLVVRQALGIALTGLAAGLLAFVMLARYLATLLFRIQPFDAVTLVVVPLALLTVMLLACAVPARRAARVDPVSVLR